MAEITTREKRIDEHDVRCTPHKGRPGARLLARLLKHVGPAFGQLRGIDMGQLKSSSSLAGDIAAFAPAIAAMFESLTPDDFDSLSCEILSRCAVILPEGGQLKNWDLSKPANIDDAFAGDLMLMFKVMAFALEVNYAGFFLGLGLGGADAGSRATVTAPLVPPL